VPNRPFHPCRTEERAALGRDCHLGPRSDDTGRRGSLADWRRGRRGAIGVAVCDAVDSVLRKKPGCVASAHVEAFDSLTNGWRLLLRSMAGDAPERARDTGGARSHLQRRRPAFGKRRYYSQCGHGAALRDAKAHYRTKLRKLGVRTMSDLRVRDGGRKEPRPRGNEGAGNEHE
jgi:hypothetical protein